MTGRDLAIAPEALEALRRHAAAVYPEECCGFLLGRERREGGTVVERVLAAVNEHPSARTTRYLIPPERVLGARREARRCNLRIVGYYHSHPDRPAEPSLHDLVDAWPAVSYLIVPVDGGVAGGPRSWRLREDGQGFEEEGLALTGGAGAVPAAGPRGRGLAVVGDGTPAPASPTTGGPAG